MLLRMAVLLGVLAATGCSATGPKAAPTPTPTPSTLADCISADEQRTGGVRLPLEDGDHADAVILGSGDTGVLFANQSDGDLCTWKTVYASYLVSKGYRVLLFNWSGGNAGKDVLAGVAALRAKGVHKVFLIGASLGATAVVYAAGTAQPPVDGVVSLSAAQVSFGVGAIEAAKTLTVPAIFVASQQDGNYANDARLLYAACPSKDKKLDIEPGSDHGWALVNDKIAALIETFLTSH